MTRSGAGPPSAPLAAIARALDHRGPDGEGRYRSGDVGMAQTRLAIIDLETGDQPLYEPGGAALIANGEIYNYIELREELRTGPRPPAFATRSDCELPLHLYRRHGLDFARHLRGMYALALHDPAAGTLVLARDPFGIKPLYYAELAEGFAFASEPRALFAAGLLAPRADLPARNELIQMQFTTGRRTIFAGVDRVLPGETIIVRQGRIVERRRREALPAGGPLPLAEADALARLDTVLADSVRVHQRADVPFGLFLSGGVDSNALLVMMARLAERPVKAFTVGFAEPHVADERAAARAAARRLGAEHVEVSFDESDFWRLLPAIAAALDDPTADYAILPTYKLAERARQEGLKLILTGEGGDELFAGYGRYRSAMRPWWAGGRMPRARGLLDGLGVLRSEI
ncbi:MAG TPA: asparagine synthase (glutamine-hydrolyzing), partial [Stellaceae bacterium]|nr:asparagine synthase (glutamine-hydrolyzing) [Stellaceae bacterium]